MPDGDFVHIGTLARAHGLKGEIAVFWHAETFDLLRGEVYLQAGSEKPRAILITGTRMHKGYPLVSLEGTPDRDSAEALRGLKVLVPRAALPQPGEGEFYIIDIEGCSVYLAGENAEDEKRFGVVGGVDFSGGQEIWLLRADDGREALFPAVPEFVREIDIESKRVTIAPPPGLLELYLENK